MTSSPTNKLWFFFFFSETSSSPTNQLWFFFFFQEQYVLSLLDMLLGLQRKIMTARKNITRTKPRNQLIRKAESRERHDLLKTDSPSPWCSEKSLRRLFPRIQRRTSSTSTPRHCFGELKLCLRLSPKHHTLDELKTKRKTIFLE